MAKYFNFFPKTYYLSDNEASASTLTNIISRFSFEQSFKENSSVFYTYDVKDSDTPEGIAYKMYGSSERHWIILMMNDIENPMYDWPLDQREIIKFINSKYSANANTSNGQTGLAWSQISVKEYVKVLTKTHLKTNTITVDKYLVDANSYANIVPSTENIVLSDGANVKLETSKEIKTYYTYEIEENDKKRTIKILKPEFAPDVEEEFRRVISNESR